MQKQAHYNYFRDYNPRVGRYSQSDPIGLSGGINHYGYAGGNGLRFVDTKGLKVLLCKRPMDLSFIPDWAAESIFRVMLGSKLMRRKQAWGRL